MWYIFGRFIELGSSSILVKELRLDDVTSKAWTTQDGRVRHSKSVDKSLIYKLLNDRTYLGELRHREEWGEHEPIIDRKLWDDVQAILATNGRQRSNATRALVPFLLKGIIFGADGRALTPWFTRKKNGRLYRYYLPTPCRRLWTVAPAGGRARGGGAGATAWYPARAEHGCDVLAHAVALDPTLDEAQFAVAMTRLDRIWDQLFPAVSAQVYRWTDPAGKVHYGDRPPAPRANRSSEDRSGSVAARDPAAVAADRRPLAAPALSRLGLGACLADDMGLGKTIQVLAVLLVQRAEAGSQR